MEPDKKNQHSTVQTYAEDMAQAIEDSHGSIIKKIIHGEEAHEELRKELSPESKNNKFFMLISFLLLLSTVVLVSFLSFRTEINTIDIAKQFTPIIFNDASIFLEVKGLTKDQIIQTVFNEVNATKVKTGGVEGIYLTENKNPIGLRKFLTLTHNNFIPGDLIFVSDNFLMGVVNGSTKDFFILVKVRSLADAFDSLRAWENKIFTDLHGFFGVALAPETKYLLTKDFQNGIVENKNARILYDLNNKIVMSYVLADDNSVIITNTENAAHEIMLRLASSQIKK